MKFLKKYPLIMIVIGIAGISLSAIFVKYSQTPSVVAAFYRLTRTVVLMTSVVLGEKECRQELMGVNRKTTLLCAVSDLLLVLHFTSWFEPLTATSVASSTVISHIEVIWVAMGCILFLEGKVSLVAMGTIFVTVGGSVLIASSDCSSGGDHLFGNIPALAAVIFYSVYTLIGCQARGYVSTAIYTYIVYVFCALALRLAAAISGLAFTGYGMRPMTVGFPLSVCSTLLGHSISSQYLKFSPPFFVSVSKLCEPAVATLFVLFLFNEVPEPLQIMGGAVIIGDVPPYPRVEKKENDKKNR